MIGGPNQSLNLLADLYTVNSQAIVEAMTRIASGKRVSSPGDDFAGYVHAQKMQGDIDRYRTIRQNLQEAKGLADFANGVGNNIAADFIRLKELKGLYDAANGDPDRQTTYQTRYDATVLGITDQKTSSYYDGIQVYQTGMALTSVEVDPSNSSLTITVAATGVGDESAIDNIANTSDGAIQNEINDALTYAAQMGSISTLLQRTMDLVDTATSSKQAAISVITDVDMVQESANLAALQIRRQATMSMLAQANIIQGYGAKLYGGTGTADWTKMFE